MNRERLVCELPTLSFKLLLTIILSVFVSISAFAQENTGSLRGTVKDSSGAAIPGAKVSASSASLVRSIETVADRNGGYLFAKLPAGSYIVTISQTGFKTAKRENVYVTLGSELSLDIPLTAGEVTETITITSSDADAIDVTSSKVSTNLTEQFIDNTPKGRTFNTLLQAAPGVFYDTRAGMAPAITAGTNGAGGTGTSSNGPGGGVGGYTTSGASGSENQFIIDGVEVSNVRNAALGRESAIPFEFVREVQVKSGGFDAEYGGATGSVVNVVTKSGTNSFHGKGVLQFTGASLNSNVRGFWQLNPNASSQADFFRQKEDQYRSLFPGFEIGGPIVKERLNFFSSYYSELTRYERPIPYVNGAETNTLRVLRHYSMQRVDFAPTQKIQINSSYFWTPIRISGALKGTDPRVRRQSNDTSVLGGFIPAQAFTTSFNYTLTPSLVLEARYGYKYMNDKGNTYGLPTNPLYSYATATSGTGYDGPVVPAQFAGQIGFANSTTTFKVDYDTMTRHNIYLNGIYNKRVFGQQHIIKGGFTMNRISNHVNDDFADGSFVIDWGHDFVRGSTNLGRGTYGYYTWQDGVRHNNAGANSRNMGFYIQDQWQATPRFTINAGVRIENEFLPPYRETTESGVKIPNPVRFGWGDKIAPRIGAAYDVLGNAKWKISGFYGHFFDTMKYELARGSFGGDYWVSHIYKLDDPDITKLNKSNPGALGAKIKSFDNRDVPINDQGELDGIDPDLHPTYSRSISFASEHQLWGKNVFSIRYTRNRLLFPIEDIGIFDDEESEIYVIGNPGYGLRSTSINKLSGNTIELKPGQALFPKAQRNYDGVEFRLDGRVTNNFARGLSYNLSYTYSRLSGNYAGLANSDENGRSQPNVSRAFDLPYGNFDGKGNNVYGLLNTDRPHSLKLFGNYEWSWYGGGTNFSVAQYIQSGTPRSTEMTMTVPVFINGRNDMGRTPTFTQTDLLVAHTFKLSESRRLKLDANIVNLFNQATPVNYATRINRGGNLSVGAGADAAVSDKDFFSGKVDPMSYLESTTGSKLPRSPIYGLPTAYQGIREIRLGLAFIF